ncbi:MAG: hypothetical protein HY980_00075 [Candidatus Magasanikbacteria bacterium]|nr:hypothetical protein [Candidatus Magasanikbacteria bacterium]
MRLFFCLCLAVSLVVFPLNAGSASMTSENYQLQLDSVDVGGNLTTSTNYKVSGSLGESPGVHETQSTSTNYIIEAGFQAAASGVALSATLSTNAVSLGSLTTADTNKASQTLTVTTNSPTGYSVTITEDGNLRSGSDDINDVSDGEVTASSEEYGFRTSGVAGQYNNVDTAISGAAKTIATTSTIAISEQTTITYKASIAHGAAIGTYSHIVTITTTVNY